MKLDFCDAIFVSKKILVNFFKFVFFLRTMKLDVSNAIFVLKNKIWSIFQNLFCISFFFED